MALVREGERCAMPHDQRVLKLDLLFYKYLEADKDNFS